MKTKNHPGVYVPPPLIYVAFFLASVLIQKVWPLDSTWVSSTAAHVTAWILVGVSLVISIMAVGRFVASKNTVVTVRPATSLQTGGIYSLTRNPMYLALAILYCGLGILLGNTWTFILFTPLLLTMQGYVIRREELYLHDAFGDQYDEYKKKVRRWI